MTCQSWIVHRHICKTCKTCNDSNCSEWRVGVEEGKLTLNDYAGKMEYPGPFDLVIHCGNFYIKYI